MTVYTLNILKIEGHGGPKLSQIETQELRFLQYIPGALMIFSGYNMIPIISDNKE